jgi:uncharacterized membrane protein
MHLENARLPKGLFLLLAACALIYFSHYYSLLPNVVASHFDRRGFPNGWQTKESFFAVLAGMTVLSGFLVFVIPTIIAFMPRRLINLPNKDYWLGPDQRAASMRFLSAWSAWFGCAVYAVIIWAFDYAVQTNLRSPHGPNPARLWYVLGLFAAFTLVWTMRLFGRFGRPPRLPSA